ncbi:hypothetical protein BDR05DRAFT_971344 [Suillus weaverae]|nr:hypothetical protein BDR05DRAFT_971344 [Suillus weaverae]
MEFNNRSAPNAQIQLVSGSPECTPRQRFATLSIDISSSLPEPHSLHPALCLTSQTTCMRSAPTTDSILRTHTTTRDLQRASLALPRHLSSAASSASDTPLTGSPRTFSSR